MEQGGLQFVCSLGGRASPCVRFYSCWKPWWSQCWLFGLLKNLIDEAITGDVCFLSCWKFRWQSWCSCFRGDSACPFGIFWVVENLVDVDVGGGGVGWRGDLKQGWLRQNPNTWNVKKECLINTTQRVNFQGKPFCQGSACCVCMLSSLKPNWWN